MPARAWRHRSKEDVQAVMDPRLWGTSTPIPWEMWGEPIGIRNGHSLLINDLGVVEDATRTRASCGQASMGVWSFGYLMEQMANTPVTGVTGPQFARAWVDRWMVAQSVNGWTVSARTRMQRKIIDQWIAVVRTGNVVLLLPAAVASSAWALAQLGEASEALNRLREALDPRLRGR